MPPTETLEATIDRGCNGDTRAVLCALADIPDGGACERARPNADARPAVLLLRRDRQVWAYANRCPHFSVPLNYEPGVFFTYERELLMCAHHSAMFRFEDGFCVDGPCQGSWLDCVPIEVDGDVVL